MGKINNLRDLILTGGRTSEIGIQNYIEKLSESDSKLNLDMLDEVVTSLENIYLYNQNAYDNEKSSTFNIMVIILNVEEQINILIYLMICIKMLNLNGKLQIVIKINMVNVLILMN